MRKRLTTAERELSKEGSNKRERAGVKKRELDLQERKWVLEEEERRKRLELDTERMRIEAEERRAILELLKNPSK